MFRPSNNRWGLRAHQPTVAIKTATWNAIADAIATLANDALTDGATPYHDATRWHRVLTLLGRKPDCPQRKDGT